MKNKLIQKSLSIGITFALFVGVVFVSNTNLAISQNVSSGDNVDLGVTANDTEVSNSSSLDKKGNWTDGNTTQPVTK